MSNTGGSTTTPGGADDTFASSKVVTTVFEDILGAVHDGTLQPGDRVSDGDIAQRLGVSRTPVREALQRLRDIGIIEASASRFTRIAVVSPQQTADAMVVFVALYGALVRETVPLVTPDVVAAMQVDHEHFLEHLAVPDAGKLATANADFFAHLPRLSANPALQRGITSVVHQIRLGGQHLPAYIDIRALAQAQGLLIAASRDHDLAAAQQAMRMLGLIEVPLVDPDEPK
jgi:DNA-binding GntR family transcriptional regulator